MDLTVIIVSFNTKKITLECIESVLHEGSNLKLELIVVDNGSTDSSVNSIKHHPKFNLGSKKKILKLVQNDENLGFAKANNQGIKIAKGKYILLLNSDTIVKKNAFKKLIDFADAHPKAGAVVPRLLNKDGTIQPSCFNHPTLWRTVKQYWLGWGKPLDKYYPKDDKPVTAESAVMAAFLITPQGLDAVGLLDERYFMFFEDLEYCRQLEKYGLKVFYLPTAQVIHVHGASGRNDIDSVNQWRRQIPSSKIYHGLFKHYFIFFIMWSSQKVGRVFC